MIKANEPGVLRAAINSTNRALVQQTADGTYSGRSAEIATQLAAKLDLDLRFVAYQAAAQIYAAADRDEWDIAFLACEPSRKDRLAFSAPYLVIEATLLKQSARSGTSLPDFDQPGMRIAATRGAAYENILRKTLKSAQVIAFDTPAASLEGFVGEGLDAVAGVRQSLEAYALSHPNLRILEAGFALIEQCVAVPIDRADDLAWIEHAIGLLPDS